MSNGMTTSSSGYGEPAPMVEAPHVGGKDAP